MGLKASLISYWDFNEGASGNAVDAHGSNTLTETSGTIASTAGQTDNARDFEADDTEYFGIGDNDSLSTGDIDFTFTIWLKAESLVNNPVLFRKGDLAGSGREYALYYNTLLSRLIWVVNDPSAVQLDTGTTALSTGVWYFCVCGYDSVGNVSFIQVNQAAQETNAQSNGVKSNGAGEFQVGASTDQTLYWDGPVNKMGFWKRALTTAERAFLYNGGNGRLYSALDLFLNDFGTETRGGPPHPSAPWFHLTEYPPLSSGVAPPPAPTPTVFGQEFYAGAPLAGAPWIHGAPVTEGQFIKPSRAVPRAADTPGRGKGRVSLSRVLDATTSDGRNRLRRFTEELSSWFNDLTARGVIRFNGPSDWTLLSQAHEAAADPGVADDGLHGFFVGAMWVNTASHQGFVCMSAATGAAVWKQITV